MKRTLVISALALIVVQAASAATPQDPFKIVISNHGISIAIGDFHSWTYDRRDDCYYDANHRRYERAEYDRLLAQERGERDRWNRREDDRRDDNRRVRR